MSDKNADIKNKFIFNSLLYYMDKIISKVNKAEDKDAYIYITYLAEKIAAAFDKKTFKEKGFDFIKYKNLSSIFNTLNGNNQTYGYNSSILYEDEEINFPEEKTLKPANDFYKVINEMLSKKLEEAECSLDFINSCLEVLEQTASYVPLITDNDDKSDISLYEHIKQSLAIGSCIFEYLSEKDMLQNQEKIYNDSKEFYEEKSIMLYSMDFSGIQAFIYGQYGKEDVLKNLRARSFYLEILLENVIDELLVKLSLSRANLLYAGGGHAYFIFADTEQTKALLDEFDIDLRAWMQENFGIDLFIGSGFTACSCNDFLNKPEGAYSQCFSRVSSAISEDKLKRYNAAQILSLNNQKNSDSERECKICHSCDNLDSEGVCSLCSGFAELSKNILKREIFTVVNSKKDGILPIYKKGWLGAENISRKEGGEYIKSKKDILIRAYSKNSLYKRKDFVKTIYAGDYHKADTLEGLLTNAEGIKRLGVLRADIDNLGKAFVGGFAPKDQTLSKSAAFSRKLTQFFKYNINHILKKPEYKIPFTVLEKTGEEDKENGRKMAVIYSGGDDVFVVGAWRDVLEFAIDLYKNLKKYTQGTLSISAGFGIYMPKYPISYMAAKTGELEEYSKKLDGKNVLTVFDKDNSYHWEEFIDEVMGEKFPLISEFFDFVEDKGKSLLYNLLELFRKKDNKINLARLAYTLARLEPKGKVSEEESKIYQKFKENVYKWMLSDKDTRQVITAIYIYSYLIRKEEDKKDV